MPPTMKSLGLDRLSFDDRVRLAQELFESIEAEAVDDLPLPDELKRELDRAIAEDDADPDGGMTLDELEARLRSGR